jgi:hypothetical protein
MADATDDGTDEGSDAGEEVPSPIPDAGLCCQITQDLTDDENWNDCRFPCPEDGGVRDIPWLCDVADPMSCDDPRCVLGATCQGVNGYGTVMACDAPTTEREGTLCPMAPSNAKKP